MSALFEHVLSLWEQEPGAQHAEIQMSQPPEDPTLYLDKAQISIALINLLRNAADVMPDGGTIAISSFWERDFLVISVKDEGPGIDAADLPRIFDPFFTAKAQGSGLGLTTVNRIVSDHRGEIKVWSRPGEGTEFKIYLPPRPV